jgi:hypothetical protein
MRRDEVYAPIVPGLPVLDELGDALTSDFTRREQQRRRRHQVAGVVAGAITAVVATTVAIIGGGAEQARATQIATGRTAAASWRLMLIESDSGVCLQLRPRDTRNTDGSCRLPGRRIDSTIARARINGQAFVYGFLSDAAPAIRLSATGETQRLAARDLLPTARDPRSRGSGFIRSVSTKPLPTKVRETRSLPAGARVFVVAIPRGRDRTVIVEPRGAGNRYVVIRVPNAASR